MGPGWNSPPPPPPPPQDRFSHNEAHIGPQRKSSNFIRLTNSRLLQRDGGGVRSLFAHDHEGKALHFDKKGVKEKFTPRKFQNSKSMMQKKRFDAYLMISER